MQKRLTLMYAVLLAVVLATATPVVAQNDAGGDPLPSWNEGATKSAMFDFVARVTQEGGPDCVPVRRRETVGRADDEAAPGVGRGFPRSTVSRLHVPFTPGRNAGVRLAG